MTLNSKTNMGINIKNVRSKRKKYFLIRKEDYFIRNKNRYIYSI